MARKRDEEIEKLKAVCSGRWPEIISALCNVDAGYFDGRHKECPRCGGKDRYRCFDDDSGGAICGQCFDRKNGDGFSTIGWLTGRTSDKDFPKIAQEVAKFVGYTLNGKYKKKQKDPAENLKFEDWHEGLVAYWCANHEPIQPAAVAAFGGRLATYRGQHKVIAFPVRGPDLDASQPVGWVISALNGKLPVWHSADKTPSDYVKVKTTSGSKSGVICADPPEGFDTLWKSEGLTDSLALQQMTPGKHWVATNSAGAGEKPFPWLCQMAKGRRALVLHDCDEPGQRGATYSDSGDGKKRPGWCPEFVRAEAAEVRNIVLPYPITPTKGKDFRDWLLAGHGIEDLTEIVEKAPKFQRDEESETEVDEAVDDPHRLARVNLHRYAVRNSGATIKFWRGEWFAWKRTRYRKISDGELRAKMSASVKEQFNDDWKSTKDSQDELKPVRKVTQNLINNVIRATESLCIIPEHVEMGTWIDGRLREKRNYISFQNGILDIEATLDQKKEILTEHSLNWFSTLCLPYDFNPDAECPKWLAFLRRNLENDIERIYLLQEWAGYLLLPDTGFQKFLVLEGEGANGKSVYCAGIEAMLGRDNCSHVSLEVFGDRFSRTQTLGKLVNIAADVGEMDKVAEGFVKSFTSGETMFFDRKGISGVDTYPTARLMLACNNRPRFSDRSSGITRRMMICPWRVQIDPEERISNMDKAWWWEQAGELPGMFRWAFYGLIRLRNQQSFTEPSICREALAEYQDEMNPARVFLLEVTASRGGASASSAELYERYKQWCKDNGYRPLASSSLGKEIRRIYPHIKREKMTVGGVREWRYSGMETKGADW